jgi:hypothetical protein
MRHRLTATVLAAGLGIAVLAGLPGERSAFAQPSPEARTAASALFDDGRRLMSESKFNEACPKLEESQRLDPGTGTLYQLSVCYESIGRIASAWIGFRDVAVQSANAGQAEREKIARGKASALEARLTRLKITAPPGTGVEVKRDGAVVSPALWGTPVALDPGVHKVSASAPGKEPWEITVQLDQPGATVSVEVPTLLDKKPGGAVPPPVPTGDKTPPGVSPPPSPPPADQGASPRPWQKPLGITATVLGAGGLAAGVALGFLAKSSFNTSNQPGGGCSATANICTPAGLS